MLQWNKVTKLLALLLFITIAPTKAQELFVISEPASNMPAKSIAFRATSKMMNGNDFSHHSNTRFMQRSISEALFGLSRTAMVHVSAFGSNYAQNQFRFEGISLYSKFRLLSIDDVHQHFRLACFQQVSVIDQAFYTKEVNLNGDNTGVSGGFVATQLLHKLALSATAAYVHTLDNISDTKPEQIAAHSMNYTFSAGYLLLPFKYKSYNQPNVNLYVEFNGKNGLEKGQFSTLDIHPAIQLILKSYIRFDVGYRHQLYSTIDRSSTSGFLVRMEYNFFNAFK